MSHVTMICATYNRPLHLEHLIACLRVQTHKEWSLILLQEDEDCRTYGPVTWDGNIGRADVPKNWDWGNRARHRYVSEAPGQWVGMTHDDNYYVPSYFSEMLRIAEMDNSRVVICNMAHNGLGYGVLDTRAEPYHVDLGGWLAHKDLVVQTPYEEPDLPHADGLYVRALATKAGLISKHPGILFIHN